VAELGSAFAWANLGYSYIEAQSPAYIEGCLKVLKADMPIVLLGQRLRQHFGKGDGADLAPVLICNHERLGHHCFTGFDCVS
jgi:hypothetical protein